MLQWGVKLIWEPELLNLLLKLVFDRKLISKAREEEVKRGGEKKKKEEEERNENGIGVVSVSGQILHWLLCFRLNLFPPDEVWDFPPENYNLCFRSRAEQAASLHHVNIRCSFPSTVSKKGVLYLKREERWRDQMYPPNKQRRLMRWNIAVECRPGPSGFTLLINPTARLQEHHLICCWTVGCWCCVESQLLPHMWMGSGI